MQPRALLTVSCLSSLLGLVVSPTSAAAQTPPPQPPPAYPQQQGYPQQQQQYPQQQGYPPQQQQYPPQQQQYPQQQQQYPQQQGYPPQQQQQYPQQQGYPPQQQQQYPQQQGYPPQQQQQYPQQQGYPPQQQAGYEPPPPPRRRDPDDDGGGAFPDLSLRADPLHWLIAGRLPVEMEVQPLKALRFLTVQLVPIFVTWSSPPALNLQGREDNLTQHSNGWGPISGASIGLGFWLGGKPLEGYVLRASYANYSYEYKTKDGEGNPLDQVTYVERRVLGEIGSYSRYGAFIIGGTIQLGAELNDKSRCVSVTNSGQIRQDNSQKCEDLQIVIDDTRPGGEVVNLRSSLHPVVFDFTFTLGVAF